MSDSLVDENELKKWTKYHRTGDLIRFLRERGIPFWEGKGDSIVTTIEAINARLMDPNQTPPSEDVW